MKKLKCAKCGHEYSWLRISFWQAKTYYCLKCGYSFRRTWFKGLIQNPIYAIGKLSGYDNTIIFVTKETFDNYIYNTDNLLFITLKNSPNLKI